ncbi:MAG: lytic transglycosylase domain-containing protein [Candidatus Puniceispirillaceae bacterium]
MAFDIVKFCHNRFCLRSYFAELFARVFGKLFASFLGGLFALFTTIMPANAVALDDPRLKILSDADVLLYQDIFDLQEAGNIKTAAKIIPDVDNPLLMGHVLSQKYLHPTAWRSSFKELSNWLSHYNDHPAASRISWLAKKRKPANAKMPKAPKKGYLNGIGHSDLHSYRARIPQSSAGRISPRQTRAIASKVRRFIRSRAPTAGNAYLSEPSTLRYLTKIEEGQLRGEIAHAYFIFGLDQKAIRAARHAIGAGRQKAWMGYWAGGLAAWRDSQYPLAKSFFITLAEIEDAPAPLRAGAAYWSYRAFMRDGDVPLALSYLDIALSYPTTYYGVMAMQLTGQTNLVDFSLPEAQEDLLGWLLRQKGGRRALAMLQLGNYYEASREIRYLYKEMPERLRKELISFAVAQGMADLAFRVSDYHKYETGEEILGGLYPRLALDTELYVDEALVFAIIRKESGFSAGAKSRAKAAGMMQIMPATAAFITKNRKLRTTERHKLYDPNFNIQLGQQYIQHLLDEPVVDNNLAKMLAAYNGGPGNLNKWLKGMKHKDDMMLFVESLPARETRIYVKAVLTNLWMYRTQFDQKTPALRAHVTDHSAVDTRLLVSKATAE